MIKAILLISFFLNISLISLFFIKDSEPPFKIESRAFGSNLEETTLFNSGEKILDMRHNKSNLINLNLVFENGSIFVRLSKGVNNWDYIAGKFETETEISNFTVASSENSGPIESGYNRTENIQIMSTEGIVIHLEKIDK